MSCRPAAVTVSLLSSRYSLKLSDRSLVYRTKLPVCLMGSVSFQPVPVF